MRDGVIEQQGAPLDLFERPASRFVAAFLGSPQMSFLPGRLERSAAGDAVRLGDQGMVLALPRGRKLNGGADGAAVLLGLRPEHLTRSHGLPGEGIVRYDATIELIQPTGSRSYATFRLAGEPVVAELQAHDVEPAGRENRHRHQSDPCLAVRCGNGKGDVTTTRGRARIPCSVRSPDFGHSCDLFRSQFSANQNGARASSGDRLRAGGGNCPLAAAGTAFSVVARARPPFSSSPMLRGPALQM